MDKLLHTHKRLYALPEAVADDLTATCMMTFSVQYQLFEHYKKEKLPLFGLTSKAHALVHCCLQSKYRERTDRATYILKSLNS